MLRTAGDASFVSCGVDDTGYVGNFSYVNYTCVGVRPAFKFNLTSKIFQSDVTQIGHMHTFTQTEKASTCTSEGLITFTCTDCGYSYDETTPKRQHKYIDTVVEPTKDALGYTLHTCSRCGDSYKDTPVSPLPTVAIKDFVTEKTVDYKTTITFTATVKNEASGATVHWFMDGKDAGTGNTFTVKEAKKSYTIVAKYMKDGKVLDETDTEKVTVDTGFFAKLKAFFRGLFRKLPIIIQEYVGMEKVK